MSNTIVIAGNVGKDPEQRKTQDGKEVSNFSVATKVGKDKTTWLNCVAFGKTAELVNQYVKKGSLISVVGVLHVEQYEKDGEKKTATKVHVDKVQFLGGKKDGDEPSREVNADKPKADMPEDEVPF